MSSVSSSLSSGSGLDVQSTVEQLIYTERAPERLMQQKQAALDAQASAMRGIQSGFQALEKSVFDLKDFTGALTARKADSSAPDLVSAVADSSCASSTHTVVVQKLATISSYYTKSITDTEFSFATGSSLTLQVGDGTAADISLDGKTLQGAAEYINGLGLPISANTVTDSTGTRLALVSTATGLPGSIQITNDHTNLSWQTSSPGQNAELLVDGVPIQSATNSLSGVIPGVTLTLSGETTNPVRIIVGPDTGRARQAVSDFVDSFNAVINAINAQFKVDPSTNSAGPLASDSTLRGLQTSLLSAMSYVAESNSGAETLRSIGVEMQNDGTLKVNDNVLNSALKTSYSAFQNFFQSTSPVGFARQFDAALMDINDSVQGPIALDLNGIQATRKSISQQIEDFEVRVQFRQQQLYDEYSRIDVMLREMSSLQSQISSQLGSLDSK